MTSDFLQTISTTAQGWANDCIQDAIRQIDAALDSGVELTADNVEEVMAVLLRYQSEVSQMVFSG